MTKQEAFLKKNHPVFYNASRNHRTHRGHMIDFVNYPYLRQIYLEECGKDAMKSTQSGLSEWLMCLAFCMAMLGKQIFHVLPTDQLVGRFVKNRFDKSVEHSEFYHSIVHEGAKKRSDAMHLKHVQNGAIAFVGSNSTAAFTEFPADILIVDEEDECDQINIEMAVERLSNSDDRREFRVANPTVLKFGIHARWIESDQSLWHIKAPCGHHIHPHPFKHLLRQTGDTDYEVIDRDFTWESEQDIRLICDVCGKPVPRYGEGEWIPTFRGKRRHHHINKLFSTKLSLREIVERFDKGLANDEIMQRVYNADFGWAYTADGAKVSEEALNRCVRDFALTEFHTDSACVLGADVGTMIHVKISSITAEGELRSRYIGSVQTEKEFEELFARYKIVAGVIDAQPERRMSERLCRKFPGLFRCFYTNSAKSDKVDMKEKTVSVNRTAALDNVKESVVLQKILLPKNAASIPEFYEHMTASTRMQRKEKNEYEWVETGPDHLFHASAYELIAKNMLMQLAGA